MLAAVLKAILKLVLTLGVALGLIFMVACTVFVIICIIRGDIKINIVKHETEKEKK